MTIPAPLTYKINEEDYLAHHLFSDSQNIRLRKRRTTRRFIIPILYTLLGVFLLLVESYGPAMVFLVVGFLYMYFYPNYSLWTHKRYYKKHVRDQYQNNINKAVSLQVDTEELILKTEGNEVKMKTSELVSLSETPSHYFLRTKSNSVIILPKHAIEEEALKNLIHFLQDLGNIAYINQLNWRWK